MNLLQDGAGRSLPTGLSWRNEPAVWGFRPDGLHVEPDGHTDTFRKFEQSPKDSACFLYTEVSGDFSLAARLSVVPTAFGDAGAISIRRDETMWAKLCVERSPAGQVSIVSVVTDGWSDDANNELLPAPAAELRITRRGNLIGMHYRETEGPWRFVRTFGLDWPAVVQVGLQAQAPLQAGCRVHCTSLTLSSQVVTDFRSGA
jgi:uncharacterized protein